MDTDRFLNQLQSKAAAVTPDVLLRRMGYGKPGAAARERLSNVLSDPELGLEQGGYDFRYDSKGFLAALCEALGMAAEDAQEAISAITSQLDQDEAAFKPYLFVDTEFRRRNEPVFAMALLETQRYVSLPPRSWRLPLDQRVMQASEQVRQHMAETQGKLLLWGDIKRYLYFFAEGRAIEIAVNGRVRGEREVTIPSRACLEHGLDQLLIQKGSHVRSI